MNKKRVFFFDTRDQFPEAFGVRDRLLSEVENDCSNVLDSSRGATGKFEPYSVEQIELFASNFRRHLAVHDQPWIDILRILDLELAKLLPSLSFIVVESSELEDGILAFTTHEPLSIVVSNIVYDQASCGDPAARMVLAHELGHLLLHRPRRLSHFPNAMFNHHDHAAMEMEAHQFAMAFLMPLNLVEGMSLDEISELFGVSSRQAELRKAQLNGMKLAAKLQNMFVTQWEMSSEEYWDKLTSTLSDYGKRGASNP